MFLDVLNLSLIHIYSAAQQIVNIDGHLSSWAPREERVVKLAWIAEAAGRAGWKWCEMDNLNFGTGGGSR